MSGVVRAVEPDAWENTAARPAGLGGTSARELLRFARPLVLGDRSVLSAASSQRLRTRAVQAPSVWDLLPPVRPPDGR